GDDECVGDIGCEVPPVDLRRQMNGAHDRSPADDAFVQNIPATEGNPLANLWGGEHHPRLEQIVSRQNAIDGRTPVVALDLDQEAQAPEVDPQDRHSEWGAQMTGAKHRAVAAEGDHN